MAIKDVHLHTLFVPGNKRVITPRTPVGSSGVEWFNALLKATRAREVEAIEVMDLGGDRYYVMNGVRRCFAALNVGHRTIRATVIIGPKPSGEMVPLSSVTLNFM